MQLRNARLCLDCEEVHEAQQCPACASETFVFMTRWVPVPERRAPPRPAEPQDPEGLDTYRKLLEADRRKAAGRRLMRNGVVGLALFGVARWMWQKKASPQGESPSRTKGPHDG
jgi:hypothetical protein